MKWHVFLYVLVAASFGHIDALDINARLGENVTLPCSESDAIYPAWRGPDTNGIDVLYSYSNSDVFSHRLSHDKVNRLGWGEADNRSLIIRNLTGIDGGKYVCTVRIGNEKRMELFVREKVNFVTLLGNTNGIVANGVETITLNCTAVVSDPDTYITWKFGNQSLTIVTNTTLSEYDEHYAGTRITAVLEILADRSMDGTDVYCMINNDDQVDDAPVVSNTKRIELHYHPIVTIDGPSVVVAGDTDMPPFRCFADGSPAPTITWYHNDVQLFNYTVVDDFTSEYSISKVERRHSGNYTCQASNEVEPDGMDTTGLIVKYKADVSNFTYFNDNGQTILRCEVDSDPAANVTVYRQGQGHVLANGTGVTELEYSLDLSNCLGSGLFTCAALNERNDGEPATASININANCPPQKTEQLRLRQNRDDALILDVTLHAYPIPGPDDVTWSKYENGMWVRQEGGFIDQLAENMFKCSLEIGNRESVVGYYRLQVRYDRSFTYTQMFEVLPKGDVTDDVTGVNMACDALFEKPLVVYVVCSTAGCVVGIILTSVCLVIRMKCAGSLGNTSFGKTTKCCGRKQRSASNEIIYEEIGEKGVSRKGVISNIYSDLNDNRVGKEIDEKLDRKDDKSNIYSDLNENRGGKDPAKLTVKMTTTEKKTDKFEPCPYIDMTRVTKNGTSTKVSDTLNEKQIGEDTAKHTKKTKKTEKKTEQVVNDAYMDMAMVAKSGADVADKKGTFTGTEHTAKHTDKTTKTEKKTEQVVNDAYMDMAMVAKSGADVADKKGTFTGTEYTAKHTDKTTKTEKKTEQVVNDAYMDMAMVAKSGADVADKKGTFTGTEYTAKHTDKTTKTEKKTEQVVNDAYMDMAMVAKSGADVADKKGTFTGTEYTAKHTDKTTKTEKKTEQVVNDAYMDMAMVAKSGADVADKKGTFNGTEYMDMAEIAKSGAIVADKKENYPGTEYSSMRKRDSMQYDNLSGEGKSTKDLIDRDTGNIPGESDGGTNKQELYANAL